ncbi:ATP-binding protein [Mechercharimyces sp. CAU 1602]|uniref:ATP-binding protein n=1 Tax=Mechercharimyces sp. CAU 1602 TaxID=2973933 RepID=UPI0021623E4B|nr:ATP-binding protein [Mechercharimyces sp. CAU 1602]MCS1351134.1 ATP-binding protein [Mechercharimyces sp. CAU 1602]
MKIYEKTNPERSIVRIVPHTSVLNSMNRRLMTHIHSLLSTDRTRFQLKNEDGIYLRIHPKPDIWFITKIHGNEDGKSVEYFASMPTDFVPSFTSKISNHEQWKKCTIEEIDADEYSFPPEKDTDIHRLCYARHDIFSLAFDYKEQTIPARDIVGIANEVQSGESIDLFVRCTAMPRVKWKRIGEYAWGQWKKGKIPPRPGFDPKRLTNDLYGMVGQIAGEVRSLVEDVLDAFSKSFFNEESQQKEKSYSQMSAEMAEIGELSTMTKRKRNLPIMGTSIRAMIHSPDPVHRQVLAHSLSGAFDTLGGDNQLERIKINIGSHDEYNRMKRWEVPARGDKCLMSVDEIGKLIQLPTADVQEEFHDVLETVTGKQDAPAQNLIKKGIEIGTVSYKKVDHPVHMPTNNLDALCLPRIVIGGMGTGKTRGFGANWLVEAVKNGYGAIAIDPNKGEIGDELEAAGVPLTRIRFGDRPISLDWREVYHSPRGRARLASAMLSFFANGEEENRMQTGRFIRATIMGMQTGELSEILKILSDEKYRKECILKMPPGIHCDTLNEFDQSTDRKQQQLAAPIYNRLDIIMGDQYLGECMNITEGIDMVELMSKPGHAFVFDVPSSQLGREVVDIIVNLLSTKIDLAMTLRKEEDQFPCFVLLDEPHQFLRSASLWKSAVVESRKWRVGYIWTFHSWEQIQPRELREIMRSANPHYHVYQSSPKTYKELEHEIKPFTADDGVRLPKYHAINVVHTGEGTMKPFIAKMAPPPTVKVN